jgi:hypothetical protein
MSGEETQRVTMAGGPGPDDLPNHPMGAPGPSLLGTGDGSRELCPISSQPYRDEWDRRPRDGQQPGTQNSVSDFRAAASRG